MFGLCEPSGPARAQCLCRGPPRGCSHLPPSPWPSAHRSNSSSRTWPVSRGPSAAIAQSRGVRSWPLSLDTRAPRIALRCISWPWLFPAAVLSPALPSEAALSFLRAFAGTWKDHHLPFCTTDSFLSFTAPSHRHCPGQLSLYLHPLCSAYPEYLSVVMLRAWCWDLPLLDFHLCTAPHCHPT